MSVHSVLMSRDMAELIVDLLEDNFKRGDAGISHSGEGADFAVELRKEFKMCEQEKMKCGEVNLHELLKQELEKKLQQGFSDDFIKRLISSL